jgi:type II secretory pathway pseudopilin PulG
MTKKRNAHTVVELIIIIVILAAMVFIAVPRLRFAALYRKQADTVARKIVTDLRRTRQLAISNAATNPNGFALNRSGLTYQIVDGNGTPIPNGIFSIDPKISCSGGTNFQFGPIGNLDLDKSDSNQLTISAKGTEERSFKISITPATGMIQCTKN